MKTEKAIEMLERAKKTKSASTRYMILNEDCIGEIITLLKTQQEMVTKLEETRKNMIWENSEYQKNLDQIDLWAMEIQGLIKKIRGKI